MSALLDEVEIDCPYCGETVTLVVDLSVDRQDYIEDCFVCCRPMRIICIADGGFLVSVATGTTDG